MGTANRRFSPKLHRVAAPHGGAFLLHITRAAAAAIEEITGAVPGSSGVRIAAVPEASTNGNVPSTVFDFYAVDAPENDDSVVEERGVQLFLEPEVVPYLEDKLLDAEVTGEEVRFIVEPQEDGHSPNSSR